jgi:hypothetical protein
MSVGLPDPHPGRQKVSKKEKIDNDLKSRSFSLGDYGRLLLEFELKKKN